ncbi:MAG: aminopeptidase P family protein [Chloroflexi bacterium]|nr:aminopeptidase P family protein [Chloroflexota bacterium]
MSATASRLARIRAVLAARELDALLVSQPHNRRYLCGLRAGDGSAGESAGWLIVTHEQAWLLTSFLHAEEARTEAPDFRVHQLTETLPAAAADVLGDLSVRRVGTEHRHLTAWTLADLQRRRPECTFPDASGLVERLRAVKEPQEVAAIRRAAALTDAALAEGLAVLRPGISERALAWHLERYLREHGSDGLAFEVSVASGPRAALPHARPTDRAIGRGEPVWIDMGARVDGYCADLTRTLCLGPADEQLRRIHAVVCEALATAVGGLKAGLGAREADALGRSVIEAAGYGEAFGHSLGHGVGLAVHEPPALSRRSEDVLAPGMVVTVEPGIYLPNRSGVRVEDLVLLSESGVDVLSQAPKQLELA